jgi:type IV pilus assembly protein PilC
MTKIFSYEGFEGNNPKNGMVEAESPEKAIDQLTRQGIIVININEAESSSSKTEDTEATGDVYKPKKIKNKHKILFTKKLSSMVKAGLPILKTLRMLEDQTDGKHLKVVAKQIRRTVEGGSTLSEAFSMHDGVFDQVYINLLKAGESSGKLTVFLEKLVIHLEKIEKIRRKVKGALMYPIILVVVAVAVIMLMLVKVVPIFQQMFSSMGHDLPGPTLAIIKVSEFIRDPAGGGVMVILIIGIFFAIKTLNKKSAGFRERFDKTILRIPLIGDVIIKSALSKIAMVSSNLSAAGVSVIESLTIVSKTVRNVIFLQAFDDIKKGVAEGKTLSQLYSEHEVFPPTFWQMIAVGEETGRIDDMLNSVANYYEEEFDLVVDRLTELLEPIMIVFMGITVGFIIVAMYMPIFQIGKVVTSG